MDLAALVLRARTQLLTASMAPDAAQRRFFRTRAWTLAREARAALAEAPPLATGARSVRELHARGELDALDAELRALDARELAGTKLAAE